MWGLKGSVVAMGGWETVSLLSVRKKQNNLVRMREVIYKTQKQIFKAYPACLGPSSAGPDLKV